MKKEIIDILIQLKEKPSLEKVDHILLLDRIYAEFREGEELLKPIVHVYLSGFDELPRLTEKHLWNEDKYNELRMNFVNSHNELLELVNSTLEKANKSEVESTIYLLNNSTDVIGQNLDKNNLTKGTFLNQVWSGKKIFKEIELVNLDLRNENLSGLTFIGCFISADLRNANLRDTKFIGGNVKTSDFRLADLTNGLMEKVSFESTKFKRAKMENFIFKDNYCYSAEGIGQDDFNEWICETE